MSEGLEFQTFIDRHVATVEPLAQETNLAAWDLQTTSSEAAKAKTTELSSRLAKIFANPEEYAFLRDLPPGALQAPLAARQRTLLLHAYLGSQMADSVIEQMVTLGVEIEDRFNTYRATVRGKQVSDNEIDDLLIASDDVDLRRETWVASKEVGAQVSEKVLDLVRLRNREAHRLGFSNYYAMGLELDELNEDRLFELLDELCRQSDPLWKEYKDDLDARLAQRFHTTPDQIRPWHHASRFFQEPGRGEADLDRFFGDKNLEELTSRFFQQIGLPVDDLLARADLYERPGKSQHAFCMDVDRQGDIRVLCNVRSNERWMGTMLHEFGHAVYDKFSDPHLPYLLRGPAHTLATESIALFMGRLTKDAHWLQHYAGVSPEEAGRIAAGARKEVRDHLLVFMRWCFVMANFERALYRDPDQDLNTLWWNLVEKYQWLRRPEGRNAPDWAAKIHLATAPVYYHNYQLGEMVASQLLHHLREEVLSGESPEAVVTHPKVGAYLREKVFYPGATRPWEDWLEHATGERLNPAYFVGQLRAW